MDTLKEESFKDFPECYKTHQYPLELITAYVPGKKRRKYFRSKEMWPLIAKNLEFVDTWQQQEYQRRRTKQSAQALADEEAGVAPKKSSDRGAESRTAISHVFEFVKLTRGPEKNFIPKEDILLSKITIDAFLAFYRQRVDSPSTANNVAKMLVSLYKFMKVSTL